MLSLILLYFVWKRFADLAVTYGKSKHNGWLGIVCYLGGLLCLGAILGLLNELLNWGIDFENSTWMRFVDLPIGIGCCYILYKVLERKWKSEMIVPPSIDEIGTPIDAAE